MNEIRLSGILQGIAEHSSDGQTFITASLEFSPEGHAILLVAAGLRARALQPFDSGDAVRVTGRLAVYRDGYVILVNEAIHWAITRNPKKFAFDPEKARASREKINEIADVMRGDRQQVKRR